MLRLAFALFAVQAGFHGFTAALPLALHAVGIPDPEIGLVVGTAALVQVPAAFLGGPLVDRFGGVRLFAVGAAAYVAAALILLLPGVEPRGSLVPFAIARMLQGVGIAAVLPSALSLVPRLVRPARHGFGLAFVGSAHNLTLVALPPLSIWILAATSLQGVAVAVIGFVLVGLALAQRLPFLPEAEPGRVAEPCRAAEPGRAAEPVRAAEPARRRGLTFVYRRSWTTLLLVVLFYVAHWGAIVAYLPQRAAAAGADIGLFFAADGVAIFLLRVPSGWLADRVRGRWLVFAGLALTFLALVLLLVPPTTPILVVSGLAGGAGGGLLLTPILLELSRRSTDADRGSAFSLFSGALAGAMVLGSIGGAPVVATAGFEAAIAAGIVGLVLAGAVSLLDGGLARRPGVRGAPRTAALSVLRDRPNSSERRQSGVKDERQAHRDEHGPGEQLGTDRLFQEDGPPGDAEDRDEERHRGGRRRADPGEEPEQERPRDGRAQDSQRHDRPDRVE